MCGFYCITFIKFMLAGKILLEYTNFFLGMTIKGMKKIIYKYFKNKYGRRSKSRF